MSKRRLLSDQKPGSTKTLISGADGAVVRRTVLPGGLRVITEAMPSVRSVSFGVWVGVGSRDETVAQAGSSHYLEHLLFKGTKRRDALEISAALDAVGGEMNAFTAKEYTCFYARVLDTDLPIAVDVISDMMTSSLVRSADVDSERGVILEEIAMHEDDPGDVVHDTFAEALFGDTPLGRPILGTVNSINSLQRTAINGYYRRRYKPENMVVAVAGNVDHAKVVRLVGKAFDEVLSSSSAVPAQPRIGGRAPASNLGVSSVVRRPTEQAHLVLGVPALARVDERRFALGVLNGALGGGMSSRLFQEVREKRGLAYSVYSYAAHHAETGMFGVYAGCQ
ncbi:MAG TPA: pitrilysin family protein, partial [Acidothermaceae bacterium]|nr:pitrilysin family protein [Acidothermaceae bacterium]